MVLRYGDGLSRRGVGYRLFGLAVGIGFCFPKISLATPQASYYETRPIMIPVSTSFIESESASLPVPGTNNNPLYPLSLFEALQVSPELSAVKTAGTEKVLFPGAPSGGSLVVWEGVVLNDPSTVRGSFDFSLLKGASFQTVNLERGTNPLVTTAAMGGIMTLETPERLFLAQKMDSSSFVGQGDLDSMGGRFVQLTQFVPFSQGALYLGGSFSDTPRSPVGTAPLRKQSRRKDESLSLTGNYGSVDKTQLVFLCRTADEKFDDVYDSQGTFQGASHYLIGRLKNLSQDGRTRSSMSIGQIMYDRRAYHQSQTLSKYKGMSQTLKVDSTHIVQKGIQLQGGIETERESAKDYGFSEVRDTISLFMGPKVRFHEYWTSEGSIRVNQGPHDTLMGIMTGVGYQRKGDGFFIKADVAQKRPSLYYLHAQDYSLPQFGTLPQISYPVGNASLKKESSWGVLTRVSKGYWEGQMVGGFEIFYRKFENYIYPTATIPRTYTQGGGASTWGFGPKVQIGTHSIRFLSQIQWFQVSHSSQVPDLVLSPAHAQALNQLSYDSPDTTSPKFGGIVSITTHYKPYSTVGQTKSYSLVTMGMHYGIQENILGFVRVNNLLNKRIQDPYDSLLELDPFSFRVGIKIEL